MLSLGAAPFYLLNVAHASNGQGGTFIHVLTTQVRPVDIFGLFNPLINGSTATSWYWVGGLALIYVLIAAAWRGTDRHRPDHRGWWHFSVTGIAAMAVLFATGPWAGQQARLPSDLTAWRTGDLSIRGFLPLLVIALSLLVLAITERSVMLGVVGVAYTGLALLANLYDVENQLSNLGYQVSERTSNLPNLLLPSLFLLVVGLVLAGIAKRRKRPDGGGMVLDGGLRPRRLWVPFAGNTSRSSGR